MQSDRKAAAPKGVAAFLLRVNGTRITQMARINADKRNAPPCQIRAHHNDPRHPRSIALLPDILVPKLGLCRDELLHHLHTLR